MVSLDTTDVDILMTLREDPVGIADLSSGIEMERSEIRTRLSHLQDSGLVAEDSEQNFSITVDGQRVLEASGTGTVDDRVDTSPAEEQELESLDLAPDREAAIRNAYVFLKYWGDATKSEITDAIYYEHPAGYEAPDAWWQECVRSRLASLPMVRSPDDGLLWRYTGEDERDTFDDGRHIAGPTAVGSVRHEIEHIECTESERMAVRAAFDVLFETGTITAAELADAVYEDYPAGYDAAEQLWEECLRSALAALPNVHSDSNGTTWRYERRPNAEPQ